VRARAALRDMLRLRDKRCLFIHDITPCRCHYDAIRAMACQRYYAYAMLPLSLICAARAIFARYDADTLLRAYMPCVRLYERRHALHATRYVYAMRHDTLAQRHTPARVMRVNRYAPPLNTFS